MWCSADEPGRHHAALLRPLRALPASAPVDQELHSDVIRTAFGKSMRTRRSPQQAQLRERPSVPHALDVKTPVNPVHWFLNGKDDVRSSYYLEDVATEFHIQGLEVDWACVVWDGDFRFTPRGWQPWSFRGNGWQRILAHDRQRYLKNAYRVLLSRARQGMVVVVPRGDLTGALVASTEPSACLGSGRRG